VDVYSFGVILYEMLENKLFFGSLTAVKVAWAVEGKRRPSMSRRVVKMGLDTLVSVSVKLTEFAKKVLQTSLLS
jgi:hypothetical protein